jgi:hypothetical protein
MNEIVKHIKSHCTPIFYYFTLLMPDDFTHQGESADDHGLMILFSYPQCAFRAIEIANICNTYRIVFLHT